MTEHASPAAVQERRELFGHPRALTVLAGTEFWERVSFHGMLALLTLYMVEWLFTPGRAEHVIGFALIRRLVESATGPLSMQALASMIFGLYMTAVASMPILGGIVGDRFLGRSRTVVIGCVLMSLGHLCMAFEQAFFLALLLLVIGSGAVRANLSPQIGQLYAPEDRRRDVAFQIYGAAVNGAAFIAPLATGSLSQAYGWHAGFLFAAVGMLVGLAVYLRGRRALPAPVIRTARSPAPRLTAAEWRRTAMLCLLVPLIGCFWISQSQVWNTYSLWVRDHLNLRVHDFIIPVPWLQSLDGLAPFIALPPMLAFWRWQAARGREPDELTKIAIGCFLFAIATLWLGLGQFVVDASGRTPFLWAVAFHLMSNLGWLYVAPTTNALFCRAAPAALTGTLMAAATLATAIGSLVSGRLGGFYEQLSPLQFWCLHAGLTGAGGIAILAYAAVFRRRLSRPLQPDRDDAPSRGAEPAGNRLLASDSDA